MLAATTFASLEHERPALMIRLLMNLLRSSTETSVRLTAEVAALAGREVQLARRAGRQVGHVEAPTACERVQCVILEGVAAARVGGSADRVGNGEE